MSFETLRWAYSQPISNPVAKNVLAFMASHNFSDNQIFFNVDTICSATAFKRSAVFNALKWLLENNYLIKHDRKNKKKGVMPIFYMLNLPNQNGESVDNSVDNCVKNCTVVHVVDSASPCGGLDISGKSLQPQGLEPDFLRRNRNKSNIYKSFYYNELNKKSSHKEENRKKHDWAEKKNQFADVEKQSNSWKQEEYKKPSADVVKSAMLKLPKNLLPKRYKTHE